MNKVGKIIAYILVALLLVGAIGLIIKFTNGGTTDFKTFYVTVNDKEYTSNADILLHNGETKIETKYTFASNKAEKHKGYKMQIVTNISDKTQFYYSVDGQDYLFSELSDVTAAFNIKQTKTGFTITNNSMLMQDILQNLYSGKTVEVDEGQVDYENVYFTLIVSSADGSSSIRLGLKFNVPVKAINLDKEEIVF